MLDLFDLVHHKSVDLFVAGDDDLFLGADHREYVPFAGDYVRFTDLVDLHEFVDYFLFVPGRDLEQDERLLVDYQLEDAAFDCFLKTLVA